MRPSAQCLPAFTVKSTQSLGVIAAAAVTLTEAVALIDLALGGLGFDASAALATPTLRLQAKLHAKIVLNTVTALWADW